MQIDTKRNRPEILNGKGEGVVIEPNDKGRRDIEKHGIEWIEIDHGTRVTIELEARYQRGRGSVDEYLEQTAMANPHVTLHYVDPDGGPWDRPRVTDALAAGAAGDQAASLRRRVGPPGRHAQGNQGADGRPVPHPVVLAGQPGGGPQDLRDGQAERAEQSR